MHDDVFTIEVPVTGYSDQLQQVALLFELGTRTGRDFVVSPLTQTLARFNDRSARFVDGLPYPDAASEPYRSWQRVEVPITNDDLTVDSGEAIVEAVGDRLARSQPDLPVRGDQQPVLPVLRLACDRDRLAALLADFDDEPMRELRHHFRSALLARGHRGLFPSDAPVRVTMHLRLGDVARIGAPWGSSYAIWNRRFVGAVPEPPRERLRAMRLLIRGLTRRFGPDTIAFSVHSDGLALARRDHARLLRTLPFLREGQRAVLLDVIDELEQELTLFSNFDNVRTFFEPDPLGAERLAAAICHSDVVVANGLQRMAAKLAGIYGDPKPQALFVLAEQAEERAYHEVGLLKNDSCALVPIELGDFSIEPVARFIEQVVLATEPPWQSPFAAPGDGVGPRYDGGMWRAMFDRAMAGEEWARAVHALDRCDDLGHDQVEVLERRLDVLRAMGDRDAAAAVQERLTVLADSRDQAQQDHRLIRRRMGQRDVAGDRPPGS